MSDAISRRFPDPPNLALPMGRTLFVTGQTVVNVFLVRSGHVALERHSTQGQRLVLQSAGPGEVLAEASVYAARYHCDAVARELSAVASLPKEQFRSLLAEDSALAEAWAMTLARGVHEARLTSEIRTLPRLADRLDAWLDARGCLPPKGQWQDVADELGVTREAFYRELSRRRKSEAAGDGNRHWRAGSG